MWSISSFLLHSLNETFFLHYDIRKVDFMPTPHPPFYIIIYFWLFVMASFQRERVQAFIHTAQELFTYLILVSVLLKAEFGCSEDDTGLWLVMVQFITQSHSPSMPKAFQPHTGACVFNSRIPVMSQSSHLIITMGLCLYQDKIGTLGREALPRKDVQTWQSKE